MTPNPPPRPPWSSLIHRLRGAPGPAAGFWIQDEESGLLLRFEDGVAVADGEHSARPAGAVLVSGETEDLRALLAGSRSVAAALRAGRLRTDHIGALLELGRAAAAASGLPPRSPAPPLRTEGAPWGVPRRVGGGQAVVEPAAIAAYADATGDRSVAYLGQDAVAPMMLHVRLFRDEIFALMQDAELGADFGRLLHVGHDARFARPLRPHEVLVRSATLDHVSQRRGGLLLSGTLRGFCAGELVVEATTTFYVAGQRLAETGVSAGAAPLRIPAAPTGEPDHRWTWTVPTDQTTRYAAASLDDNPLHLDPAVARAAGHPDVLVHGLCVLARGAEGVVSRLAHGDPRGLTRLGARFTAPVCNGDPLETRVWQEPDGARFSVHHADGRAALSDGIARWGAPTEPHHGL